MSVKHEDGGSNPPPSAKYEPSQLALRIGSILQRKAQLENGETNEENPKDSEKGFRDDQG